MLSNTLSRFTEKYPREAFVSLEDFSNELSVKTSRFKFPVVNVDQSVNMFNEYMEGYVTLKCNGNDELPNERIMEQTKMFLDNQKMSDIDPCLFEDVEIMYRDSNNFISSYINGVKKLNESVDNCIRVLKDAGVSNTDIAFLVEMADQYIDTLAPRVESSIDYLLKATSYEAPKVGKPIMVKNSKPVFI